MNILLIPSFLLMYKLCIYKAIVNYYPHTFYGTMSDCIPHACIHFSVYTSKEVRDVSFLQ